MKANIKGHIVILTIGDSQYIELVSGTNHDSRYFKKWQTDLQVSIDTRFELQYSHAIEIEVDPLDCLIDEYEGEYYLVQSYIF